MRWLNGLLTFLMVVLLAMTGATVWFTDQVDKSGPVTETTMVTIPSGAGTRTIANLLESKGIINSRHVFLAHQFAHRVWERGQGRKVEQLKAGDYEINPGYSVRKVAEIIRSGKATLISVSIPEGLTSYQIVNRLLKHPNLTGEITEVPPEGFLMPDTYRVSMNASRQDVLELMANEQRKFLRSIWQQKQPDLPLKDVSEALILASIIEKETGRNDDPARIAAVFVNRLRKGMRLQSDPTILYGKFGTKVAWGSTIYRSDIQKKTTHNTYQIDGLPPTPICNPGRASIRAALNPAQTKELFFVANGKGGHIFSETVQQHNRAVAQWRKIEKEIRAQQKAKKKLAEANAASTPKTVQVVTINTKIAKPKTVTATEPTKEIMVTTELGTFPLPIRRPSR
ncbi:MAG: endolytic transglycosylase MltG [Pseudomonadota bacterium]